MEKGEETRCQKTEKELTVRVGDVRESAAARVDVHHDVQFVHEVLEVVEAGEEEEEGEEEGEEEEEEEEEGDVVLENKRRKGGTHLSEAARARRQDICSPPPAQSSPPAAPRSLRRANPLLSPPHSLDVDPLVVPLPFSRLVVPPVSDGFSVGLVHKVDGLDEVVGGVDH